MLLNLSLFKIVLDIINSKGLLIAAVFSLVSGFIIYKSRKEANKTVFNFLIKTQEILLFVGTILIIMYYLNIDSIELLLFFIFSNCYLILLHFKHKKRKRKV